MEDGQVMHSNHFIIKHADGVRPASFSIIWKTYICKKNSQGADGLGEGGRGKSTFKQVVHEGY
jgi:hypothetical protein